MIGKEALQFGTEVLVASISKQENPSTHREC